MGYEIVYVLCEYGCEVMFKVYGVQVVSQIGVLVGFGQESL